MQYATFKRRAAVLLPPGQDGGLALEKMQLKFRFRCVNQCSYWLNHCYVRNMVICIICTFDEASVAVCAS